MSSRITIKFGERKNPLNQLMVSDARILDLGANPEYSSNRRTFGTGLPGYASGWFRLHKGEKALVYLTRILHEGGRKMIDSERSQEVTINKIGF